MKNKSSLLLFTTGLAALFIIVVISCNKKFDAPPAYIPPNISATSSIAMLKAMHVSGGVDSITTDMIIAGVVIANDSSGNFYKQIVIQDSTGGIAVNIDDYNLYASFPIGRKVYVKLKGLYMAENTGLIYVGGSPDNGGAVSAIASRLVDQYIVKAETNVAVTPAVVTISDLKNNYNKYMYTLVQLQNVQVKNSDTAKTYAFSTATAKTDASITVQGCNSSDTMVIRSSGYSNFANVNVPNGNGTLTAVYAYYKSPYNSKITPQVIIRDTSDVQFAGMRCDGTTTGGGTGGDGVVTSIKNIRAMYTGSNIKLGAYKIGGVVISDAANKNISSGSVILQDGDRGISVYFGGTVSYNLGDSIVLDISGDSLLNYRGSLEVKTAYGAVQPAPVATGKIVTPLVLTITQLNSMLSDIEFTLIKIQSATASGASTFGGNQKLTDATGNTTLYTSSSATFAATTLPTGAKDWVGYGSFYNTTTQFQIRNTGDITDATTGGTGGGGDTTVTPPPPGGSDLLISEYVEGSSNNKYLEIYNAGSTAADLSKYMIKLYANGSTSITNQATLDTLYSSATLAPGAILVIQQPSAALALPAGVTAHSSSVCNFNGDDAITLEKDGVVIDAFGTVGIDPGTSWTVGTDASGAVDHSVRRNASVTAGNPNWTSSSASEWTVGAKDDVSNLGTR